MIPVQKSHLYVAIATHPGMRGKNNEDRYAVSAHRVSRNNPTPSLLALVCDGIGGHRAGEVAAEMAVEIISTTVANGDPSQPLETLKSAMNAASEAIRDRGHQDSNKQGMGATAVCAWVIGERLYTTSLGDSRLYLIRNGDIHQITTDHTWVQEAIEAGALTSDQARGHPNSHIIRKFLGAQNSFTPDFRLRLNPVETDEEARANQGLRLIPGDRLLLCSDGLTDLVTKTDILGMLKTNNRDQAVARLVSLANERGGHDNITVVLLEAPPNLTDLLHGTEIKTRRISQVNRSDRRVPVAFSCGLAAMIFMLIAGLAVLGWWYVGELRSLHLALPPTPTSSAPRLIWPTHVLLPTGSPSSSASPASTLGAPQTTPSPQPQGQGATRQTALYQGRILVVPARDPASNYP